MTIFHSKVYQLSRVGSWDLGGDYKSDYNIHNQHKFVFGRGIKTLKYIIHYQVRAKQGHIRVITLDRNIE